MFSVYALYNSEKGKMYIGQTADIEKRLKRHNGLLKSRKKAYTSKNRGRWALKYQEKFNSRAEALVREKELKSFRGREFIRSIVKNNTSPHSSVAEQLPFKQLT